MCTTGRKIRNSKKMPLIGIWWILWTLKNTRKGWASKFYWPEMHEDAKRFVETCPECQWSGNISQRNAILLNYYNLQIDLFVVWGIDFMGPFVNSHGYEHILVIVGYVSKWFEAIHVGKHLRKKLYIQMIKTMIFSQYDIPRILVSDGGSHFIGKDFKRCLAKLGIEHRVSTTYHQQTNGQVQTSNTQLKGIRTKMVT
jgi:transposase InsO family protein